MRETCTVTMGAQREQYGQDIFFLFGVGMELSQPLLEFATLELIDFLNIDTDSYSNHVSGEPRNCLHVLICIPRSSYLKVGIWFRKHFWKQSAGESPWNITREELKKEETNVDGSLLSKGLHPDCNLQVVLQLVLQVENILRWKCVYYT